MRFSIRMVLQKNSLKLSPWLAFRQANFLKIYMIALTVISTAHASSQIQTVFLNAKTLTIKEVVNARQFYNDFRQKVLFLQKDRELTPDIKRSYEFIMNYPVDFTYQFSKKP